MNINKKQLTRTKDTNDIACYESTPMHQRANFHPPCRDDYAALLNRQISHISSKTLKRTPSESPLISLFVALSARGGEKDEEGEEDEYGGGRAWLGETLKMRC